MGVKALLLVLFVSLSAPLFAQTESSGNASSRASILDLEDQAQELRNQIVNEDDRESRRQIRELIDDTNRQLIEEQRALGIHVADPSVSTRSILATPDYAEQVRIAERYMAEMERVDSKELLSGQMRLPIITSEISADDPRLVELPVAPDAAVKSPRQSQQ
jgi:hypothetical protein